MHTNSNFYQKSILIPLTLQSNNKGTLAKITLTNASNWIVGVCSDFYIKEKEDPQIIANKINRDKSMVFASLIVILNCTYVINA